MERKTLIGSDLNTHREQREYEKKEGKAKTKSTERERERAVESNPNQKPERG
jgi:hypothetical protein